jgi:hypothetical protein
MLSSNPTFMSTMHHERNRFIELIHRCKLDHAVYPSKHFFERVVERNLDAGIVLEMIVPIIKEFRETTYNVRSYTIQWRQHCLFAMIEIGPVSGNRRIILKTLYDREIDDSRYDVVLRIN